MVYSLVVHDDAKADLEHLWQTQEEVAALIFAALQEIEGDQRLLDGLTINGFGAFEAEKFEVRKWLAFWNRGVDLWRFKLWDLEKLGVPYRVIYAFQSSKMRYHVLGIFHRSFDYNPNDARTKRVKNAYDNL